jgi:hypothetical protein
VNGAVVSAAGLSQTHGGVEFFKGDVCVDPEMPKSRCNYSSLNAKDELTEEPG